MKADHEKQWVTNLKRVRVNIGFHEHYLFLLHNYKGKYVISHQAHHSHAIYPLNICLCSCSLFVKRSLAETNIQLIKFCRTLLVVFFVSLGLQSIGSRPDHQKITKI